MNISHRIWQNWINKDLDQSVFIFLDRGTCDFYYTIDLSVYWWCLQNKAIDEHKPLNHNDIISTDVRSNEEKLRFLSLRKSIDNCEINEDNQNIIETIEENTLKIESNPTELKDNTSSNDKDSHKLLQGYRYEIVSYKKNQVKKSYKWMFPGCSKIFGKTWNFLDHARMHEGIKPFQWDVCLKSFTQHGNLRKHSRQHQIPEITSRKTQKCPLCSCTYTEKYNLKVSKRKIFWNSLIKWVSNKREIFNVRQVIL